MANLLYCQFWTLDLPLYLNPASAEAAFSKEVIDALRQIKAATDGVAITPRIALAQIQAHLSPLLPAMHRDALARLKCPTWDDLYLIYIDLASSNNGANAKLVEIGTAIRLVHSHSIPQQRELTFPAFVEVTYFLQMHDHLKVPIRPLCHLDKAGNCDLFKFCKYCWRLAIPKRQLCPVHQPEQGNVSPAMPEAGSQRQAASAYKEGLRQKARFDTALNGLLSAEVVEFHDSRFSAPILFPTQNRRSWLRERRPLLSSSLGEIFDRITDATAVDYLLDCLHDGSMFSTSVRGVYEEANALIRETPYLIWPMLLRAEAWQVSRKHLANHWGGRRSGAGRKTSPSEPN